MDLDSSQIIVEVTGPSKCWAGDEAPEFVFLMRTHQLHIQGLWSNRRARWTLVRRMPRDVAVLVAEVGNQLFNLGWRHPNAEEVVLILQLPHFLNHHALRCQRVCIVRVVKLFWVLQVHLEYNALKIVCWMICNGFGHMLEVFFPPWVRAGSWPNHTDCSHQGRGYGC